MYAMLCLFLKTKKSLTKSCGLPKAVSLIAVIPVPKVAPTNNKKTIKIR